MAPEQGPDSNPKAESTRKTASVEESVPNNDNKDDTLQKDSIGWIYLLKKDQLVEQCRNVGISTAGFTVEFLRKRLAETLRSKQLRKSTENLLHEAKKEVQLSESTIIQDEVITLPVPTHHTRSTLPEADIMTTVQKWNLRFSGETDLMEFLERVEELAECYHIHQDQLLPAMLGILSGNALKWYRIKRHEIHCWAEFRAEIQKFFLPKRFLSQIEQNFYTRRQNNRERAKDFILNMLTLARQHPDLRKHDHLDRIYDGLRTEYRHYVRRGDFTTLDDLISLTEEFEALKKEDRPQPTHMMSTAKYNRKRACWRCKKEGHIRATCRNARKVFCSYCGHDGILSRDWSCHGVVNHSPIEEDTRYHIAVTINHLQVLALIDTGATKTYINERVAKHLTANQVPSINSRCVVQMADKSLTSSLRVFGVQITYRGKSVTLHVAEISSLAEDMILGMDFLIAFGLELRLDGDLLPRDSVEPSTALHALTSREFLNAEENNRLQMLLSIHQDRFNACSGQCTMAEHVIHSSNVVADCLSRAPLPNTEPDSILSTTSSDWYHRTLEQVCKNSEAYPDYQIIKGQLFKHISRRSPYDANPEWKLCVPPEYRRRVLQENHDEPSAGHFGIFKTTRRIQDNYYWPGMFSDVSRFVRSCQLCVKYKIEQRAPAGLMKTIQTKKPGRRTKPQDMEKPMPFRPPPEARPREMQSQPPSATTVTLTSSTSNAASGSLQPPLATVTPAARLEKPVDLFRGITIAPPNKKGRHHQYVIRRKKLPPVKVPILNKTYARLRCNGRRVNANIQDLKPYQEKKNSR